MLRRKKIGDSSENLGSDCLSSFARLSSTTTTTTAGIGRLKQAMKAGKRAKQSLFSRSCKSPSLLCFPDALSFHFPSSRRRRRRPCGTKSRVRRMLLIPVGINFTSFFPPYSPVPKSAGKHTDTQHKHTHMHANATTGGFAVF